MIYNLAEKLKHQAILHPMVNMASFGDIQLYDDKPQIAYPYVNFDVVSSVVEEYIKTYTIRIYVNDRNQPYIAYNKTEQIMDDILKTMQIETYQVNYFTLDFKDMVNGCYADFEYEIQIGGSCSYETLFNSLLLEQGGFTLLESGDLIILNN